MDSQAIRAWMDAALVYLRRDPDGLTEWQLIEALRANQVQGFEQVNLSDSLSLFRTHFLLFHALHRLDETLRHSTGEAVAIHCLRICLCPATDGGVAARAEIARPDPLKAYYLDLGNLEDVDAAQVEALLSGFWRRFHGGSDRQIAALEVLGLDRGASRDEIRQRYRRLAQTHHPDRGGDTATLQRINEAMLILADRR